MKQIRIGNQTAFSAATPREPFEYAVENGFDAFEWFPDRHESGKGWDESDINDTARSYVKETARKHDIMLSVHASLQANPLSIETHGIIIRDIKFGKDVGAELINTHLSVHGGIEDYAEAIIPIVRQIHKTEMKLSIENTPFTTPEDFNRLFAVLREMNSMKQGRVGMCLDVGHANLCDVTRNDYLRFLDRLSYRVPIIHIHMHENYGDTDTHLPVFTGPAGANLEGIRGLFQRLKKRNFSGAIILEQWPEPRSLLKSARERLIHVWNEV